MPRIAELTSGPGRSSPTSRGRSTDAPTDEAEPVSVRLETSAEIAAPVGRVWDELVDWPGQCRWIPFTTVRIETDHDGRSGRTRRRAVRLLAGPDPGRTAGRVRGHRLDAARDPDARAELEVLHLGPYFTGEGVFACESQGEQ